MNGRLDNQPEDSDSSLSGACDFVEENAAGYALGALDLAERGMVDQHLLWCARCRAAVAGAEAVTACLPFLAPPVPGPSAAIRTALMERVRTDLDTPLVSIPPVVSRPRREPREAAPERPPRPTTPVPAVSVPRWRQWVPAALIAPLVIALIIVSAWANSLQNTVDQQETELAGQSPALASNGGVQLFSMQPMCPECAGGGRVGVDMDSSMGLLVGWNFDPSRKHSVWCVNEKGDKEWISTLEVNQDGGTMQTFAFPGEASDYTEVYIAEDNGSVAYMTTITTSQPAAGEDGEGTPSPELST